jgi:hypothetical protein
MNPYAIEVLARTRLQDMQREAENRRLLASGRPPETMAGLRRLLGAAMAVVQPPETRVAQPTAASTERRQEVA